jgi:polyhydroxybutyrate depolymerase
VRRAALLLAAVALAAPAPADDPPAPGVVTRSLKSGGRARTYLVHVPKGLDPKAPAPVVVVYHGAAMTGRLMRAVTGLDAAADEHRFVVVYPDGAGLVQTWNSGGIPSVAASRADDVAFTRDLLDDLKGVAAVDPKRVYAAGFSNGGMMAYKLANDLPDRFAAVCAVGGTMTYDTPNPKRPVPVIHFHGTEDLFVRYDGPGKGQAPAPKSVEATVTAWAKADGCPPAPAEADEPDVDPTDGCRVKRRTYGPGAAGSEVVLYTIVGGGHTWPGRPSPGGLAGRATKDIDANTRMWEFFRKHARK